MPAPTLLPVKLQPANVRPLAYRVLSKKHGLNIQTDALVVLADVFSTRFGAEWRSPRAQAFLEELAKAWKKQDRGLFIDGAGCTQVVQELSQDTSGPTRHRVGSATAAESELVPALRQNTLVDDAAASQRDALDWRHFVLVVAPDTQPNYVFDRVRRQFSPRVAAGKRLQKSLAAATEYFSQRYFLIADRMSRDTSFQQASFSSLASLSHAADGPAHGEITLIKNVLGRDGARFRLFGLLSRSNTGEFVLEDSTAHIELAAARAVKTPGSFFCTGMFVVVDGIYTASGGLRPNDADAISGCFHVSVLSQPVAEPRDAGLDAYGHVDFMGMHSDARGQEKSLVKLDRALRKRLGVLERGLGGHRLVLLGSNVHLDNAKVRAGLKKVFVTLEEQIQDADDAAAVDGGLPKPMLSTENPGAEENSTAHEHSPRSEKASKVEHPSSSPPGSITVVMAGSFSSQALTPATGSVSSLSNSEEYKAGFDWLAETLAKCPLVVRRCKFVLIPGLHDPWQSTFSLGKPSLCVLPQTPIPKVFVTRLERLLPKGSLVLGWNPTRINYVSQEIVLFRDDLMATLKRHDLVLPTDIEREKALLEREANGEDLSVENLKSDEAHLSSKVRQARMLVKTVLDQGHVQPFLRDLRVVSPNHQHALRLEPLPTTLALFDARFEAFEVTYNGCKVANVGPFISNKNYRTLHYTEYFPNTRKYTQRELHF